jgi:hypothetical protein
VERFFGFLALVLVLVSGSLACQSTIGASPAQVAPVQIGTVIPPAFPENPRATQVGQMGAPASALNLLETGDTLVQI